MSQAPDRRWEDVFQLPSFFDRLEDEGGISVLDLVEELTASGQVDIDVYGIVYHDRGIRAPGYDATFVHEPTGSRGRPAFSVEVDTVGPRNTWEKFDDTLSWDVYLVRTDDLAAIAWLSDEEYKVEDADHFQSKQEAVAAGRFSFGVFLYDEAAWTQRVERLRATNAPAFLLQDDGQPIFPETQAEFYDVVDSTVTEFRTTGGNAPSYLGVLELEVTID
ncbi:hypothetical protein ACFO5R_15550 [Halosolutus amylolyticus]|uniref:Restriction endonuclease n=1 Tax=Halosolutus amylolyticus TaxID=2932267 RepID=A0ABD5PTT6_9EURY|nr:hypothetical protein [Halosolutus amylolyticus]